MSDSGKVITAVTVLGGLGLLVYAIDKFGDLDIFGGIKTPFNIRDQLIKKKVDQLNSYKINPKGKWSIGTNDKQRIAKAIEIAQVLYNNMWGLSNYKNYEIVYQIFQRLRHPNDVVLIMKKFGVRNEQTLFEFVDNESMPDKYKNYITSKMIQAVSHNQIHSA
jgi:hypothetical protein